MKIKTLDKVSIRQFRFEFEQDLKILSEKYRVLFSLGTIRFGANDFTSKMTARLPDNVVTAEGSVDLEKAIWESVAHLYGLQDTYGKEINLHGKHFKLHSIQPENRCYPIIAIRADNGKRYKLSATDVTLALGIKKI